MSTNLRIVKRDLVSDFEYLKEYAMSFLLTRYHWGGDDFDGIDCSGLVQELLSAVGVDPDGDQTAQGLFNHFINPKFGKTGEPTFGALSFYGVNHQKITHVGFCLNSYLMIEAAGGNATTTTVEMAKKQNAFVRIRPIGKRRDLLAVLTPNY